MEHQFYYPQVTEIRPASRVRTAWPTARPLSQRALVEASLLAAPRAGRNSSAAGSRRS
jgi:hypothetical protein